ncbi:hypothetical protein GVAV_001048 [Gurleya vavrai]
MSIFSSRYSNLKPLFTKESKNLDIKEFLHIKKKIKPNFRINKEKLDGYGWFNMKISKVAAENEKDIFSIVNRDVLHKEKKLKKVDLGDIFQVGRIVKKKRRKCAFLNKITQQKKLKNNYVYQKYLKEYNNQN